MRLIWLISVVTLLFFAGTTHAQTLFSESWDSGAIDPLKWTVRGSTPNAIGLEVPDQSNDLDFALALRGTQDSDFPGTSPTWLDNIMSVMQFDRGDNVTVQFKAWNKPGSNAQIGVHGGFHHTSLPPQSQQHFGQDLLNTPEATFGHFVNDIRAYESGDGFQAVGSAVPVFDATAAIKANTENGAATFSITLDPVQGALWEVIIPWTNPAHSTGVGGDPDDVIVGRDTRGVANLDELSGTGNVINDQILNAIGFGQGAGLAGTTYVDDIIVFGPDGPDNADFDGDGDVDGRDFLIWQRGESPGGVTPENLELWQSQYGTSFPLASLAATSAPVPEPDVATILIAGLLTFWGRSRRV